MADDTEGLADNIGYRIILRKPYKTLHTGTASALFILSFNSDNMSETLAKEGRPEQLYDCQSFRVTSTPDGWGPFAPSMAIATMLAAVHEMTTLIGRYSTAPPHIQGVARAAKAFLLACEPYIEKRK